MATTLRLKAIPKVIVDGHDISHMVNGAVLDFKPNSFPSIQLTIVGIPVVDDEGNLMIKDIREYDRVK